MGLKKKSHILFIDVVKFLKALDNGTNMDNVLPRLTKFLNDGFTDTFSNIWSFHFVGMFDYGD